MDGRVTPTPEAAAGPMATLRVAVVIPVHNMGRWLGRAVASALAQPEVVEVVVVDDASTDDSVEQAGELSRSDPRVRLRATSGRRARGAGAARNVGVQAVTAEWVAFLDADDFYLPGRFNEAARRIAADPGVEGVCEAVGVHFADDRAAAWWRTHRAGHTLTTLRAPVPPEALFEAQSPVGDQGFCQTAGWLVRRTLLDRVGPFDECLRVHQDTALFVKLAAAGRIACGRLDQPVALRGVHGGNTSLVDCPAGMRYRRRRLMWVVLARWARGRLPGRRRMRLATCLLEWVVAPAGDLPRRLRPLGAVWRVARLLARFPDFLGDGVFWRAAWGLRPTARASRPGLVDGGSR